MCHTPKPISVCAKSSRPAPAGPPEFVPRPPEQPQPGRGDDVHHRVKDAVGHHLYAEVLEGRALHQAEQVVPLQDLVQEDAVEEAAQPEAEQVARPAEGAAEIGGGRGGPGGSAHAMGPGARVPAFAPQRCSAASVCFARSVLSWGPGEYNAR